MKSLSVLVVDDETAITMVLQILLEKRGHTVVTAGSVQEARNHLDQHRFDVAIIDRHLPGDGDVLAGELEERGMHGRVLIMTGDEVDDVDSAVIRKPFDYDAVVERIEQVSGMGEGS